MFKVRIDDRITDDSLLTNKAYYLYVYLKLYAKGNQYVYIYLNELMELLQWKDKKTVKKYLIELKRLKYIHYDFGDENNSNNFPINQPLHINILTMDNSESYTQIDINTIQRLQRIGKEIEIVNYNKDKKSKTIIISDLKEIVLRLFYLYEKNYFRKEGNGTKITYAKIKYITKCSDKNIKAINNTLMKNSMLEIIVGKRYNSDSRRAVNEYKPICEKPIQKLNETDSEK